MNLEEFASLQLDKPLPDPRNEEQLKKHSLDASLEKKPIDRALYLLTRGDEIQKLSIIQNLPNLLATDTQACMTRVVPKMQQTLVTASTEFHIAASSTFKTILEQKLVSHNVFSQTFLQSIIGSLDSRDPVISHAWLETLLDVIVLLPIDVIRVQILPVTISKGQLSQSTYSRVTCSRLLGKICTRFNSDMIQKEVLPTVQSLCQDVNSEVRASICLQLRYVAEGLGAEAVKSALLPSLVELARDEEFNVRYASVQTIVHLLPLLHEDTIKNTITPLMKKLCENSLKSDDNVICVIAEEFGKFVLGLEKCLTTPEKAWFLRYYQQLAQMGIPLIKREKPDIAFLSSSPIDNEKFVECRRCCAYNLPAMFIFVSSSIDDVESLLTTLSSLSNDPYYMVRRTVACGIHEVAKVLSTKSGRIKGDIIKLLKDDSEEVLQGMIPHIGLILQSLVESDTIGTDKVDSTLMGLGRALLKCEAEITATYNWRLASMLHAQFEILPKCFPSDFIYSYFVPVAFSRILHARPLPLRLAAGRLFLVFLRYNAKAMQRAELRSRICTDLATNPDCYVRMLFVRMMVEALSIYSSAYFKEHFFTVCLNLAEDPVANIRLKVVSLLPIMKGQLWVPTDKKLLTALEATIRHMITTEKDRDVMSVLETTIKKLDETDVRYERQTNTGRIMKQDAEDAKKLEEERRILIGSSMKSPTGITAKKAITFAPRSRPNIDTTKTQSQATMRTDQPQQSIVSSQVKHTTTAQTMTESAKASLSSNNLTSSWIRFTSNRPQLTTHPWKKMGQSSSSINMSPLFKLPHTCNLEHKGFASHYCTCYNIDSDYSYPRSQQLMQESLRNILLTPTCSRNFPINNVGLKETVPIASSSSATPYNTYWAFSSLPEIPVTLSDDEFLVDAGIRIPELSSSTESAQKFRMDSSRNVPVRRRRNSNNEQSWRNGMTYKRIEPKRHSSMEYEDHTKQIAANAADRLKSIRSSMNFEESLAHRNILKDGSTESQVMNTDFRTKRYSAPQGKTRFGFDINQVRSVDDKMKRNSLMLDKDKGKNMQSKCESESPKRHSANYSFKPAEYKDAKQKFKRHSFEVPDYFGRSLRRYSTLDVNHNQGVSKIPLRSSIVSGSRTAPATRASSPVCLGSLFRYDSAHSENHQSSTAERNLSRSLSDEEVDKICRMIVNSHTTSSNRTGSPRAKFSKLPVRLFRKKL